MSTVLHYLTAALLGLTLPRSLVHAASTCYFPDGSVADKDQSCDETSPDAPCCPQGWQCVDGGLCHLDYADYISRYTCTDRSWNSDACPHYCMGGSANGTDSGNVALLQCFSNDFCCNGDRSGNCCEDAAVSYFKIPSDSAASTTEALSSSPPTSAAASSTTHSSVPGSPATGSANPSSSTSVPAAPTTIVTSVIANPTNGAPSTVYLTMTAPAAATSSGSNNDPSPPPSSNSVIVGCAVGIPLSAILVGLLAFLFLRKHRRRRRNGNNAKDHCADLLPPISALPAAEEKTPRVSELDGFPRAAGGGIAPLADSSNSRNRTSNISEYYSSTKGSASALGLHHHARAPSEVDGTPIMGPREKPAPAPAPAPAELESPRASTINVFPVAELQGSPVGTESRKAGGGGGGGGLHANRDGAGGAGTLTSASSPDLGGVYAVGGVGRGLRIVNAVEGELDSEVEDQRDGGVGGEKQQQGRGKDRGVGGGEGSRVVETETEAKSSPPPVHQSSRPWRRQSASVDRGGGVPGAVRPGSGVEAPPPDGMEGSPVSPLWGRAWRR